MPPLFPIEVSAGAEETSDRVICRLERRGRDYLLSIFGGEEHIGAVVLADGERIESIGRPGHREEESARSAASRISPVLDGALAVVAGIHYNSISREAIDRILSHIDQLIEEIEGIIRERS